MQQSIPNDHLLYPSLLIHGWWQLWVNHAAKHPKWSPLTPFPIGARLMTDVGKSCSKASQMITFNPLPYWYAANDRCGKIMQQSIPNDRRSQAENIGENSAGRPPPRLCQEGVWLHRQLVRDDGKARVDIVYDIVYEIIRGMFIDIVYHSLSSWRKSVHSYSYSSYHSLPEKAAIAVPKKSGKVLMMMKAAKLGWAGPGAGQE